MNTTDNTLSIRSIKIILNMHFIDYSVIGSNVTPLNWKEFESDPDIVFTAGTATMQDMKDWLNY